MPDGFEISSSSQAELERLGKALKGVEKIVQKNLRAQLRTTVRPLTDAVIKEGAEPLPKRGGLRDRVLAGRGGLRADLFGGRSVRLTLMFTDRQKDSLGLLDRTGSIRHPVFRTGTWVEQRVSPPGRFTAAFMREKTHIQAKAQAALEETARELARKA